MRILIVLLLVAKAVLLAKAGPFENLGFEQVNTNAVKLEPPDAGFGPIELLLPGWSLLQGGQPVTTIAFGDRFPINYIGPEIQDAIRFGLPQFNGRYSLRLRESGPVPERYLLSQTGDIPADARQMTYAMAGLPFQVTIDGEVINPISSEQLPGLQTFRLLTLDVSRFAGQEVTLSFETTSGVFDLFGTHDIYDIAFQVPEPSTGVLLCTGLMILAARGWIKARKSGRP